MGGFSSTLRRWGGVVFSGVIAVMMTVGSTAACSAQEAPERPEYIPQWLWSGLYDEKAYPSLKWQDYITGWGKNWYIGFRYTEGYELDCDLGFPHQDSGDRGMSCMGMMPAFGAVLLTRPTYPFTSNDKQVYTQVVMSNDSFAPRAVGFPYTSDDPYYDEDAKVLPLGHRLLVPRADPKRWKKHTNYSESYNRDLVCVSKDRDRFGCLRSDEHGFYLDKYGTHTF